MENDANTPAPFSRGVTPSGKPGRGNNRYGNRGTVKCVRCRELKRACKFDDPREPCSLCASRGYPCSDKVLSEQQAQVKAQTQGDLKRIMNQTQFQWNEEENFLNNLIFLARNNMVPADVVQKLIRELQLWREDLKVLPAPQVVPHDATGFAHPAPVPMQQPPEIHFHYVQPAFLHPMGQMPPTYVPKPASPVFGNSFPIRTPNVSPQPTYNDMRQGIPRLPIDPQLPTAPLQGLEFSLHDWNEQNGTHDWNNELLTQQDVSALYGSMNGMATPQDYEMEWDDGTNPI